MLLQMPENKVKEIYNKFTGVDHDAVNDENGDVDNSDYEESDEESSSYDGDEMSETRYQYLKNLITSYVSYEQSKAWFRWFLDVAYFEIRVSVSFHLYTLLF